MTRDEAQKYFKAVIGKAGFSVEELKKDPRACHILVHHCGIFPEDVQDEDAFFEEVLKALSDDDCDAPIKPVKHPLCLEGDEAERFIAICEDNANRRG